MALLRSTDKPVNISLPAGDVLQIQSQGDGTVHISDGSGIRTDPGTDSSVTFGPYANTTHYRITCKTGVITFDVIPSTEAKANANLLFLAGPDNIGNLISVRVVRNALGVIVDADLKWPDGAAGVYTALVFNGARPKVVDSYSVTHVLGGVTKTIRQPAVSRDASGTVLSPIPDRVIS